MKIISYLSIFSIILLIILTGCESKPDIKNDFCGVHINYQYCKCAFHNQYCSDIGMDKEEAKTYLYSKYDLWIDEIMGVEEKEEYGIIEKDGNIYINSKPGEVLEITTNDLPNWARNKIATVGASISVVGSPDSIVEGDSRVLLNGLPIARVGDVTMHGGTIIEGSTNIFVNNVAVAIIGGKTIDPTISGEVPAVGGIITNNIN